ncbi:MAG TPA: hypothetical protein DDW52_04050 [Planctomycetaceae bacterium]|nr:hypothetical protein [Planctomycetaceae bacterium]
MLEHHNDYVQWQKAIAFLHVLDIEKTLEHAYGAGDCQVVDTAAKQLKGIELYDLPTGELGVAIANAIRTALDWLSFDGLEVLQADYDPTWRVEFPKPITEMIDDLIRYRPERPSDESKQATRQPAPINDNDRDILTAMLELRATEDSLFSAKDILAKVGYEGEGKRAFARLKHYGLVRASRGMGHFLTTEGLERAKSLEN